MGRRSKKRREPQTRRPDSQAQPRSGAAPKAAHKKEYSTMENIIYYALAAIGLLVLVSTIIWLLGYLKIF
jgi:hypothetical protein